MCYGVHDQVRMPPELKGLPTALDDTTLEVHDVNGVLLAFNDNWKDATNATEITATGIAPTIAMPNPPRFLPLAPASTPPFQSNGVSDAFEEFRLARLWGGGYH